MSSLKITELRHFPSAIATLEKARHIHNGEREPNRIAKPQMEAWKTEIFPSPLDRYESPSQSLVVAPSAIKTKCLQPCLKPSMTFYSRCRVSIFFWFPFGLFSVICWSSVSELVLWSIATFRRDS